MTCLVFNKKQELLTHWEHSLSLPGFFVVGVRSAHLSVFGLSIHLDPPAVIPTSHGVLGDLSGLAELAGFEFCHIRYFETKQVNGQ
jgi:hypothetical protein